MVCNMPALAYKLPLLGILYIIGKALNYNLSNDTGLTSTLIGPNWTNSLYSNVANIPQYISLSYIYTNHIPALVVGTVTVVTTVVPIVVVATVVVSKNDDTIGFNMINSVNLILHIQPFFCSFATDKNTGQSVS